MMAFFVCMGLVVFGAGFVTGVALARWAADEAVEDRKAIARFRCAQHALRPASEMGRR